MLGFQNPNVCLQFTILYENEKVNKVSTNIYWTIAVHHILS